jgi:AhpD family alkylhydroperoxidase
MSQRLNHNAAAPAGMKALGSAYLHVHQSGLPARLVDLVFLRVSQVNGCAYCIDSHSRDLLKAGLPIEPRPRPRMAGGIFDEQERAALGRRRPSRGWAITAFPTARSKRPRWRLPKSSSPILRSGLR